jgi:hypothetical protein
MPASRISHGFKNLLGKIRRQNLIAKLPADMATLGKTHWAIAEGYIPSESSFSDPALVSHETACILNAGDAPAHVRITVYFADREPVGPYLVLLRQRRGARCTCASTILSGQNRSGATRLIRRCSNPTYRLLCSTRDWIPSTLK